MSLRTIVPIAGAAIAALVFAFLRPSLDGWDGGWYEQLEWGAMGAAVWGLGLLTLDRLDLETKPRAGRIRQVLVAALMVLVTWYLIGNAVDFDRVASTILTVILAVGVIGGAWVVMNVLVNRARSDWALFAGAVAGIAAAVFFGALRGNLAIRPLIADADPIALGTGKGFLGHVEWPVLGAVLWGGGVYAMRSLDNRWVRVGIGVAIGIVTGYFIGDYTQLWQRPQVAVGSLILWGLIGAALGAAARYRSQDWIPGILLGAAVGTMWALWLRSDFGGTGNEGIFAAALPLALLGARLGWGSNPDARKLSRFDVRARAVLFLGPALLFLSASLLIPAIATVLLSLKDRDGLDWVGFDNYQTLWNDPDSFELSNWQNIFTSQLFWFGLLLVVIGGIIGLVSAYKRDGTPGFQPTGSSVGSLVLAAMLFAFATFSVLRGTFFNNLWWVVTVTTLSTTLGLTIAVLAERAGRLENFAKSLIFMPMAVSFVGASIVWRLQYQPRDPSKDQTGVLNFIWVELGKLSHSSWPRWLAIIILLAFTALIAYRGFQRAMAGSTFALNTVGVVATLFLAIKLLDRSLGGFRFTPDGSVVPQTVLFVQEPPFNNVFLMIILIWIQTGFAMVILSAAIKAVPTEFIEAAKVDGATEGQTFFRVVLPQILPTVGVVVTTLIVLVSKVFDIVKVTTGGNFGTNVLANDMFTESFQFFNRGLGSAIAVFILISVLPVMYLNVRRMQKARLN